jgi:glycosyltransferase involved in cell wall biosynthesis
VASTDSSPTQVLYLTPYSKAGPVHGGKIRANQISKILASLDPNLEIIALGDRDFSPRPLRFDLNGISQAVVGDLEMLHRNYEVSEKNYSNLKIVVFEQPWCWNEVKEVKRKYPNVKIIYSAQNIEFQLKDKILLNYLGDRSKSIIGEIRNLEIEIAKTVDRVVVVSEHDRDWYSQFTQKTILAPNGAVKRNNVPDQGAESDLSSALIVGSAHPPNIEGCLKFLSDVDLWIPPNSRIVIAGSLAAALSGPWGNLRNRWGDICVQLIPEVSDIELGVLLEKCKVILLPIPYGGGTNLKSAEALVAGRPIVASPQSFRGFEHYTEDPLVKIAETVLEFKIFTIARLIGKRIPTKDRDITKILWDSTLDSLANSFQELIND